MRRLFLGLVVAATATLAPNWALAGNQEVAEQVAANLRDSGQLHGYKIGVKFQDGTAWLRGQVTSQEQMNAALRLAFQTPGVTRVVNNLTIAGQEPSQSTVPVAAAASPNPMRSQPAVESAPAAPVPVRPLQAMDNALAAEQTPRSVSRDMRAMQASRGVRAERPTVEMPSAPMPQMASVPQTPPASAMPAQRADRVASSFVSAPAPQVRMTALQEPTLASPRQPVQVPEQIVAPQAGPQLASPQMVAFNQPAPAAPIAVPVPVAAPVPAPVATAPALPPTQAPMAPITAPIGPAPAPVAGAPLPMGATGAPLPMGAVGAPMPMMNGQAPMRFDQPNLPNYAWPCYAAYPNYAALTYPKQYSPTAWPYIGPFYPYPQVPLGWRKVTLEWSDGWWFLDFDDGTSHGPFSGLFRSHR